MAVWGSWVANYGSKSIRLGYDLSRDGVDYNTGAVNWYLTVYLQSDYAISDTSNSFSLSGSWSASGTRSISTSSGGGIVTLYSGTATTYGGSGTTHSVSFNSSISGVWQNGATASVSGSDSVTIPSPPISPPSAPTSVSSTPYNGYISVSFSAPSSNGGSTITAYQHSETNSDPWTNISSPFPVPGTNGSPITVYVRAVNAAGPGTSASTTNTPRTTPSAPQSFAASNSTFGQLDLSWSAPSSNGGASISGYTLIRTSPGTATTLLTNVNQTTYTDSSLLPYTDYVYTVAAVNIAGTGPTATVTQKTMGGIAKVWNGTSYATVLPKYWDGYNWVECQARIYNNSSEWKHGI